MSHSSAQLSIVNSLPANGSAQFLGATSKSLDTFLFIETALVTTAVVLAIKVLAVISVSGAFWFAAPATLVTAALIPTAIRRDRFANTGLNTEQAGSALLIVARTCMVVLPALLVGLRLLKSCNLELPLPLLSQGQAWPRAGGGPVLGQGQSWVCWLLYQFMYIAVAEEVFFRGYLQKNILELASTSLGGRYRLQKWISIGISAACFAVAHIIVQGQIISVLTFLPGLVLGWLFIRTRALLAPILFHGLANTCYCLMVVALA